MAIGKYLTNMAVLGTLLGALGTAKQAQQMPKDWRRVLVWGVWAAGLALAIASVSKQDDDRAFAEARREAERRHRAEVKARRRGR